MFKKTRGFRPLLEAQMSRKCTPLWREAHFEVKMLKHQGFGPLLDVVPRGRRGTFEEDLHRCIFRGRHSTKDMFMRDVRRSGRWFPERGCILEHQICRFAKMILRDRCSTSYDLASIFRGRRSTSDRWSGKIAKRIGVLHSPFHFWRSLAELFCFWCCQIQKLKKSRRIASFWMLPRSKNEEVSQNWFVLGVVMCKK